ncbi:hypothetical protein SAMN05216404_102231 [Nitrosospira multiformis]|uniref:Uncharacterized protein n=1 Tax=Nitrosospira multiformis TaxID=1231 RepID=A0A1H8DEN9_9PROT|nr:hypothetical protein SAMN05216404_102231 [Nitrosospira multiformis]
MRVGADRDSTRHYRDDTFVALFMPSLMVLVAQH